MAETRLDAKPEVSFLPSHHVQLEMKSTSNFVHSSPKSPPKPFMGNTNSYHLYIPLWAAMNLYMFHLIRIRLIAHAKRLYAFPFKKVEGTLFVSEKGLGHA